MRRNILILRLEGFFLDTDSIIQLIAIVILLVLSAFFSSAETSFITVNRIKVLSLVEEGNKRAALVIKIIDQPAKMLSAVLIGNNIVNISCSALATSFTISVWGNKATGIVTGVLTLLVLIFGEITPVIHTVIVQIKLHHSNISTYFISQLCSFHITVGFRLFHS